MKTYFVLLTAEEAKDGTNTGYGFILANPSRLREDTNSVIQPSLDTYDRGTTLIVVDNVVYNIKRDFVLQDQQKRIYLCVPNDDECNILEAYNEHFNPRPADLNG